tara:strand:+ start:1231 stop:1602 length:372 start_codon:yes stop_codon:yes gene_type:complete
VVYYNLTSNIFDDLLNNLIFDDNRKKYKSLNNYKFIEKEKSYVINLLAPELNKEDIDISIENNKLKIKEKESLEKIFSNKIEETFIINKNVDIENIQATLEKGVLSIEMNKKEYSQNKKINIQ